MTSLNKLFEQGKIGKLEIKNRIVMTAMASRNGATDDGFATSLTEGYYEARAKGGVGLIIVGSMSSQWPLGCSEKPRLGIHDDDRIPGLSRVVDVIHKHGARAAASIVHAGPAHQKKSYGLQPIAASAVAKPGEYLHPESILPREITIAEIAEQVGIFASAAVRAKKCGFDGVEIQAGHRFLINSFLSPFWNKRQDQYGGNMENRSRFLLEIISAIRATVGPDYPVWCRINGAEPEVPNGITLDLARELAVILEKAGVDAINISTAPPHAPMNKPGYNLPLAVGVRQAVNIPVIACGRMVPELAEKVLREKQADFIGMARALLADPELPNKLAAGQFIDIRPCQVCNTCNNIPTEAQRKAGLKLGMKGCTVNAALTREREYEIRPAEKPQKVLIVGSGPSGMEAARVAALRGHEVTLYEKDSRLGGKLVLASMIRKENAALIRYLTTQMKEAGVHIELGKEAGADSIAQFKPDVVVVAVGATPAIPDIPGIDRDSVLSATDIQAMMNGHFGQTGGKRRISPRRLLWYLGCSMMRAPFGQTIVPWGMRFRPFGKRVVVVGRRLPGIELAHFLLEKGTQVSMVDTKEGIPFAEPPMPVLRQYLESILVKHGVEMLTAVRYEEVTEKGLVAVDKEGKRHLLEGDTIIFAGDYEPNRVLPQALAKAPYQVHVIGDGAEPRGIFEAIDDGSRIGRAI